MTCFLCNYEYFEKVDDRIDYIIYKCNRCGAIFIQDKESEEIKLADFDKKILFNYIMNLINKIDNEEEKNFLKGVFLSYYDGLYSNKKKVKEWSVYKLADLIKHLINK